MPNYTMENWKINKVLYRDLSLIKNISPLATLAHSGWRPWSYFFTAIFFWNIPRCTNELYINYLSIYHLSIYLSIIYIYILGWVAYTFSKGSSQPRNWTRICCIAGRSFTSWATKEDLSNIFLLLMYGYIRLQ